MAHRHVVGSYLHKAGILPMELMADFQSDGARGEREPRRRTKITHEVVFNGNVVDAPIGLTSIDDTPSPIPRTSWGLLPVRTSAYATPLRLVRTAATCEQWSRPGDRPRRLPPPRLLPPPRADAVRAWPPPRRGGAWTAAASSSQPPRPRRWQPRLHWLPVVQSAGWSWTEPAAWRSAIHRQPR